MKRYLLIAAALVVIGVGITGIALWGGRKAAAAQEQLRIIEERALAAENVSTALRIDNFELERQLYHTAAASKSFQSQLEAVKRAVPTARVESVGSHRGDAFEAPPEVDSDSSAHSPPCRRHPRSGDAPACHPTSSRGLDRQCQAPNGRRQRCRGRRDDCRVRRRQVPQGVEARRSLVC